MMLKKSVSALQQLLCKRQKFAYIKIFLFNLIIKFKDSLIMTNRAQIHEFYKNLVLYWGREVANKCKT